MIVIIAVRKDGYYVEHQYYGIKSVSETISGKICLTQDFNRGRIYNARDEKYEKLKPGNIYLEDAKVVEVEEEAKST